MILFNEPNITEFYKIGTEIGGNKRSLWLHGMVLSIANLVPNRWDTTRRGNSK